MASEASTTDVIDLPFDVPEDWGTPRLSTSCQFVRDGDWIESKDQGGDDYRLLQISNIGTGRFIETGNYRWITQETFQRLNCTEILPGDVLVARMPEPTGRAWCVPEPPWRAVTAVDVAIIRTRNPELDPRFLAYFLNSPACLGVVQSLTTGTTRLRIRRADIERLQIPLPSIEEQRAIAHILGTLDDKIELNRRMNETLEAIARALFKAWFVDFDPVRAKAEGRDPGLPAHLADLFPDSFEDSELGEIPKGWQTAAVSDLADLNARTLGRSDPLAAIDYVEISEVMRGQVANIVRYERGTEPSRARRRLTHGDTVLSTVRPDRGAYFLCLNPPKTLIASTGFAVLSPRDGNWAFLYSALTRSEVGDELGRLADGGAYPAVRPEAVGGLWLVSPQATETRAAFDEFARPLYERSERNRIENRLLASLRDTLLPKLISGEVRADAARRTTVS